MKLRFALYLYMVAVFTAFGLGFGLRTIANAEETRPSPTEEIQVLASGPIHEAFAEAVAFDPEPGLVAPKAPPALIDEIPPEQKPEGDVQWIPGYWAWDDERDEYIWVSGIWRVPPPDRQWVPGYWIRERQGYQWVSGYWAGVSEEETEYLPEPPESVEVGPSSNAPSPDYIWMPGSWVWHHGRYAWRPGYWGVVHPDWIWVPAHYRWTPRGYIFVSGYWDFTVIHRGVLFAPVFFPRVHLGLTFSFSPGFVIDLTIFDDALFLRPRYCHYYYGDYYEINYYRRGIYPWFSLHARRAVYDPIYAHQRWHHRNDRDWENRLHTKFQERRENKALRPLRSFDQRSGPEYRAVRSSGPERPIFVKPLDRSGKPSPGAPRFKPLTQKERREFSQREKAVRTYEKERQGRETQRQDMLEKKPSKIPPSSKEKFSKSPIMDRSYKNTDRKKAPPAQYRTPRPNPNVEPLERKDDSSRSRDRSRQQEDRMQKPDVREHRSMDRNQKSENRGESSQDRMRRSYKGQEKGDDGRRRFNDR